MTIIMFAAYIFFGILSFICKVFAHFDFTSRPIDWTKSLKVLLGMIVGVPVSLLALIIIVQLNNNVGLINTFVAIFDSIRELCQFEVAMELGGRIFAMAAAVFAFKLFALALPHVYEVLLSAYRAMMANVCL